MNPQRPIAFVMASTNHGSMLVNRFDYHTTKEGSFGVGFQLLNSSSFDPSEISLGCQLLAGRKNHFGDGVIALDCGANIGSHTIEWAKAMFGWGSIISIEAQERIFYALAGNITLNNCFNAQAVYAAVGSQVGEIPVPQLNYFAPSSFGSLEIRKTDKTEFIGQNVNYSRESCILTRMLSIDSLNLKRIDLIKIDIEGMEMEALQGGEKSLRQFSPTLLIERVKSNENQIIQFLERLNYQIFKVGINLLAIHKSDPAVNHIKVS